MEKISIDKMKEQIANAQFIMLRYETEFTPCTGITAVAKQERRNFSNGVMIAPWCPRLKRKSSKDDPLLNGTICRTNWKLNTNGIQFSILRTTDKFIPTFFIEIEGRFQGVETPYDTPAMSDKTALSVLKEDTLYFGYAVNELLKNVGVSEEQPFNQFVWCADWETVPALYLVCDRYLTSLTLHNTFDECLDKEARKFGSNIYSIFYEPREKNSNNKSAKTALEIGLQIADVVTTVNRGFAFGMRDEIVQQNIMAEHLQNYLDRVVGIDNAAFSPLNDEFKNLCEILKSDFDKGKNELFKIKECKSEILPDKIKNKIKVKVIEEDKIKQKAENKVIIVTMGRRSSQKLHEVLVESIREILSKDKSFPILVVFATVGGDPGSSTIQARIKALEFEFPDNVVCEDGRLAYYGDLMAAADFNCMPSLYEPHGGAYEGIVIPIARAVDGLAEQICGYNSTGKAEEFNRRWHNNDEEPTGFLFREDLTKDDTIINQYDSLLKGSPFNYAFQAMRDSLVIVLKEAVKLRIENKEEYARMVLAALNKQLSMSWQTNLDGMLALIKEAQNNKQWQTKI